MAIKKSVKRAITKKKVVKKIVKPTKKLIVKKKVKSVAKKKIVVNNNPRRSLSGGAPMGAKSERGKERKVGKITHYFNNIKVIVVKLSDVLSVGDTIRIKGGKETDFKQKVISMEIDGKKIKKAKKGQSIGIKIKDRAREDYLVFKVYPVK
jgi:hypothetical protein